MPFLPPNQQRQSTEGTPASASKLLLIAKIVILVTDFFNKACQLYAIATYYRIFGTS